MTSNMGSALIRDNFATITPQNHDEVVERTKHQVIEMLKQNIRPEFLNRIDETIMFTPLSKSEIEKVVELQINGIKKLVSTLGAQLEISQEALDLIAEEGYSPEFGARPVKRVIQRLLLNPLSKEIAAQNVTLSLPVEIFASGNELIIRNKLK